MKRPLVIHVATADMGLRFLLLNQMRAIQAAGYRVLGISSDGPYCAEVAAAGVPVLPITMHREISPGGDVVALARLVQAFRRLRPTIVHTHNPKAGLLGQLAARLARVPIVINTLHGFHFHAGSSARERRFYVAIERLAARCSHAILSQNREDMQTAVDSRICSPDLISYLGNGIEVGHFDRSRLDPHTQAALRASLHIPADAQVIGAVARLVVVKGYHELFAAFRDLAGSRPNLHLLVVGPEEPAKADGLSFQTAADYGIAERTHFTGLRRDVFELYGLMDVFAHAAHREGIPRAPMEASAMGIPIVAADVRGTREAVFHGQNGLLVPVHDAPALALSLARLLDDPTLRHALGTLGHRIAVREFDEQVVFERVLATYERLLKERGNIAPNPITRSHY